jgi:mRNA-degrading endonuclease YafQ of YafQ-DinJ toxin-antitoxin module
MIKRKKSLSDLNKLVNQIADGENVPGDKALRDEWEGFRSFEVAADWRVIYKIEDDICTWSALERMGIYMNSRLSKSRPYRVDA